MPTELPTSIPQHLAIIMDGNGRWATARNLPRLAGHKAGVDAVRRTLEACQELGIKVVTLYAFSSENWKRPLEEVNGLMGLLRFYLKSELARLHKEGVRFLALGDKAGFAPDIQNIIRNAETLTRDNTAFTLCIALNYGGRQELTAAAKSLATAVAAGTLQPEQITEAMLAGTLYTHGLPDPDLIIRTSGEQRLSNFLLWQAAYSELYFTDLHWPDFGKDALLVALHDYSHRQRRFGGLVRTNKYSEPLIKTAHSTEA